MPKSPSRAAVSEPAKSRVEAVRVGAAALFRAAVECCRQAERMSQLIDKSAIVVEQEAASRQREACNDTLRQLTEAYEKTAADVKPKGADEQWWHRANALWLASREVLRS